MHAKIVRGSRATHVGLGLAPKMIGAFSSSSNAPRNSLVASLSPAPGGFFAFFSSVL